MKTLHTPVGTKAVLNGQRKSISTSVKKRTRNIIWFNSQFSQNVKTNAAKSFFRILDKHFPKSHPIYKIFNRNTNKVSYSCMNNVSQIIKQYKNLSKKKGRLIHGIAEKKTSAS